jgi:hypothetical protein
VRLLAIAVLALSPCLARQGWGIEKELVVSSDGDSCSQLAETLPSDEAMSQSTATFISLSNSGFVADACTCCDCARQEALEKAVAGSHKGLFYDNDFSYLCDPCYCDWYPGDNLKRRTIGDWITVDGGGQYRIRHHAERNIRGLGLTGNDDDFLLHRTRLYVNAELGSRLRFYGEMWIAFDIHRGGFLYDTIGGRYYGDRNDWLYEFEGGVQFGKNADGSDHSAGFWTVGLGRKFACLPWTPTLWAYYDWASGDNTVGNGYHHFQPLAHKYLGFMDLFGRRNIEDANLLLTMSPHKKLKLLAWYHWFQLQNSNDLPYGVTMQPYAGLTQADAGTGSPELGHELDLTATWQFSPRLAVLFGYSHFWSGDFYSTTTNVPYDGDADFFYTQAHLNF